eukprot:277314-Rhodomonas_salina.1
MRATEIPQCRFMLDAHLKLERPADVTLQMRMVYHLQEDSGSRYFDSDQITVFAEATDMKRFLFLLHVTSIWQLDEMQERFITRDSDVIALISVSYTHLRAHETEADL